MHQFLARETHNYKGKSSEQFFVTASIALGVVPNFAIGFESNVQGRHIGINAISPKPAFAFHIRKFRQQSEQQDFDVRRGREVVITAVSATAADTSLHVTSDAATDSCADVCSRFRRKAAAQSSSAYLLSRLS